MALIAFAGDQRNDFFAGDRCSFHPKDFIAILQVEIDLVMRKMGKKPGGELFSQVLLLNIGSKDFYCFHF